VAASPILDADKVVRALQGAFARGAARQELLQLAASRIRQAGPPYTGVYMYMVHVGEDLVLEAFDGRPTDLARIRSGDGVCGQAVASASDLNIPDVAAAEGYLACSIETQAELVVLIRRHDLILGEIDIDSDVRAGFDAVEQAAVKTVADALATFL